MKAEQLHRIITKAAAGVSMTVACGSLARARTIRRAFYIERGILREAKHPLAAEADRLRIRLNGPNLIVELKPIGIVETTLADALAHTS